MLSVGPVGVSGVRAPRLTWLYDVPVVRAGSRVLSTRPAPAHRRRVAGYEENRRSFGLGGPGCRMLFFGSYPGATDDCIGQGGPDDSRAAQHRLHPHRRHAQRRPEYMPKTRSLLGSRGHGLRNAFVSNALCAPSRATIMRGQYSHNNGVWSNSSTDSPSTTIGGWQAYRHNGNEKDNVATRLQDAGYRTGLFGKYLNGYDEHHRRTPRMG